MRLAIGALVTGAMLSACTEVPQEPERTEPLTREEALSVFARLEPVLEADCKARIRTGNCDFRMQISNDRKLLPDTGVRLAENGRATLTVPASLLAYSRSEDELAFNIAHAASHRNIGHLAELRQAALLGGFVGGLKAAEIGGNEEQAQAEGAALGAVTYIQQSFKRNELQADAHATGLLGQAGFDPVAGMNLIGRLPEAAGVYKNGLGPNKRERFSVIRRAASRG
ncbi:MAG: M48 family metalloprotease [Pseudomonadota bacterium]